MVNSDPSVKDTEGAPSAGHMLGFFIPVLGPSLVALFVSNYVLL